VSLFAKIRARIRQAGDAATDESVLRGPFQHFAGYCWTIDIDASHFPESDGLHDPSCSSLIVSEDGIDLGPPHSPHQLIAAEGRGTYSHWDHRLYFAASDGSNPNRNGRLYRIRLDPAQYFRHRAAYAIGVVDNWCKHLPAGVQAFRDKTVLEVGPGRDLGTVFVLAALGARVVAIDRFSGSWQNGWHEQFLPVLARALTQTGWPVELDVIQRATAAASASVGAITFVTAMLEDAGQSFAHQADLTVSHSAMEHLTSLERGAQALLQLSRSRLEADSEDTLGVHHVDFRDHRNFGEPLEFLLDSDEEYSKPERNEQYRRGNRVRPSAMMETFRRVGFKDVTFLPTAYCDIGYLRNILPRLRAASQSPYRDIDERDLCPLAGVLMLRA
jgi:hypothetical protein